MNTNTQPSKCIFFTFPGHILRLMSIGILMLGAVFTSASADVLLSIPSSQPTEFVKADYSEVAGSSGYQWRNTTSQRDLGQSFKADTSFDLAVFSLHSNGNVQVNAREQPYTLTVWESSIDTSMGTIKSTQAGTWFDASASSSGKWVSFELQDAVSLTQDNYYTVMLSWDVGGDASGPSHVWSQNNVSGYTGGNLWQSTDGTTYSSVTSQDLLFTAQAIPEPGSLILLLVGGLCTVLFIRRRR